MWISSKIRSGSPLYSEALIALERVKRLLGLDPVMSPLMDPVMNPLMDHVISYLRLRIPKSGSGMWISSKSGVDPLSILRL